MRKPLCELYVGDEFAVELGVAAGVTLVVAEVEVDVAVVGVGIDVGLGVGLMLIEFNEMPL